MIDFSVLPDVFFVFCAGVFGLALGSFFHVCVWRMPREESVIVPRSHCPCCEKLIPWYDNIPVLSYLILRGRCRFCQTGIPLRYPFYELMTALLFMGIVFRFGPVSTSLLYLLLTSVLIIASGIDWDHQYIPDRLSLPMIPASIVFGALAQYTSLFPGAFAGNIQSALFGAAVGGGLIWAIRIVGSWAFRQEAMGFGDVKLMAYIGGFLGWEQALLCIFLGSFLGSIVGISLKVSGKIEKYGHLPFGPYLAMGAYLCLLFGPRILDWYLAPLRVGY